MVTSGIAFALAASVLFGEAPRSRPVRLFVTTAAQARLEVEGFDSEQLKVRRDRARAVRKFREKQLRSQHGKNMESWPPEAAVELVRLQETEALAEAAYEYRKGDDRGLSECADEIADFFQQRHGGRGVEGVMLAPSAAEADVVVEVAAARTAKSLPTQERPDRCYLLFTVGPGGQMDRERFVMVPGDYRMRRAGLRVWRLAGPSAERPFFFFESYNGGGKEFGCQSAAADAASAAVDKFLQDNYRILLDVRE
jgi:hypothetical protein